MERGEEGKGEGEWRRKGGRGEGEWRRKGGRGEEGRGRMIPGTWVDRRP